MSDIDRLHFSDDYGRTWQSVATKGDGFFGSEGNCLVDRDDLHGELRGRWLAACETEQHRGTRLVARKEIIASL